MKIGETKIHQTSKIKFLGVYLDEQLNLKDHIQNRTKKANYNLTLIHNSHKYINTDTTKMLLCTLVLSQLDYVNSTLSRVPTTTRKPYQKMQVFAARIAYKKSRREDVNTCLRELHWLMLSKDNHPKYLKDKLTLRHYLRITTQSTSSNITLDIPFNKKKSFADRGFSYTAAKYWNDLPEYIRIGQGHQAFQISG